MAERYIITCLNQALARQASVSSIWRRQAGKPLWPFRLLIIGSLSMSIF
jgi:hypothetical protein